MEWQMRYVTVRRNKKGALRYYWQRRGYPLTRLPTGEEARVVMVARLNSQADQARAARAPLFGTVAWAVDEYETSEEYLAKATSTRAAYIRWMKFIRRTLGSFNCGEVAKSSLIAAIKEIPGVSTRGHFAAVLLNVFGVAMAHDVIKVNPAAELPIGKKVKRDVIWTEETVALWLKHAREHDESRGLILGFALLLFTAQRPCDVVQKDKLTAGMQWTQYDGASIKVRQQKTGRLVDITCHNALRPYLDAAREAATSTAIVTNAKGAPLTYRQWQKGYDEVCAAAGVDGYQTRDLRRTACVHLIEVGCSGRLVASISGHTEQSIVELAETYMPVTAEMARQAIGLWEAKGRSFGL